jgi:hypothetical protein
MTTQRVIWTACPNGTSSDGRARISVAVGPQLSPSASNATLAEFPDWADWPATKIAWTVTIGGKEAAATVVSAAPSSSLYQSLFLATTPVDSYQYQSPTGNRIYSYPAGRLRAFFSGLYTNLATTLPEGDGWHNWQQIVSEEGFGQLPLNSRAMLDATDELEGSFPSGGGPLPATAPASPTSDAAQLYMFMQPRTKAAPPAAPWPQASTLAAPPVPQFDFHRAYSLLQRHPALLRLFGFVVDLEVVVPTGLASTVPVVVTPSWRPRLASIGAPSTTNITPVTMTDSTTWLAAPSAGSEIADGLFTLDDASAFQLVEVDLDGATLKSLNFAQAVANPRPWPTPSSRGVRPTRPPRMRCPPCVRVACPWPGTATPRRFTRTGSTTTPSTRP